MSTQELAIAVVNEQEARREARYYETQKQDKDCHDAVCVLFCTLTLVCSFVMLFVSLGIMTDLRAHSDYCMATALSPVAVQRLETGQWHTYYRHQLTTRSGFNCTMEDSSQSVRQDTFRCSSSPDTLQCSDVEPDILAWTIAFAVLGGLWLLFGSLLCLTERARRRAKGDPWMHPRDMRRENACSV